MWKNVLSCYFMLVKEKKRLCREKHRIASLCGFLQERLQFLARETVVSWARNWSLVGTRLWYHRGETFRDCGGTF